MCTSATPFFDPHFHLWDVEGVHTAENLGQCAVKYPRYTLSQYEEHMNQSAPWLQHVGGVHVEALPRNEAAVEEVLWVQKCIASNKRGTYSCGAHINLLLPQAEDTLRQLQAMGVKSVRQILNFEPSWPYVTCDLTQCKEWVERLGLLTACGIAVFELHCNFHQLQRAALIAVRYPDVTFVLNHLGSRKCSDAFDEWQNGVAALAALPNVVVKISHVEYCDPVGWETNPEVGAMVHDVLRLFGTSRCMVASNFPVSDVCGAPPEKLFPWLKRILKDLSPKQLEDVMCQNAMRVYQEQQVTLS